MTCAAALVLAACSGNPGGDTDEGARRFPGEGGKEDVFGRSLSGVAAPYHADESLREQEERLGSEMGYRREVGWDIVGRALDPVPLLGLADKAEDESEVKLPDGEIPKVPRWQTWYGIDDFKRMFQHLYEGLGTEGRARRQPFSDEELDAAFEWNARAGERSSRWPLERYLRYVDRLGRCPDDVSGEECARSQQSKFSGAASGNVRITYSPATVRHLLSNYAEIVDCLDALDELSMDAEPADPSNFTACFEREFPSDAVLIKAQWVRADLGMDMPAYDTDAETLEHLTSDESSNDWGEGDRRVDPRADEVFTIETRNGDVYRLAGLHIMTKETRHWMWVTLFWSDTPDSDFGADRPAWLEDELDPIWSNYKMCVVADFEEGDEDVSRWFEDTPSLAAALDATAGDGATWCSNPYVEEGRGNARTNCIGCHQHGGAQVGSDLDGDGELDPFDLDAVITEPARFPENGREQIRDVFPGDYLWSLTRVDDLSQVIRSEVDYFDHADEDTTPARARTILDLEGDAAAGESIFADKCVRCHGPEGHGGGIGPDLRDRVPMRDDFAIAETLVGGRGLMPAWGEELDDQTLADVLAFLRERFGGGGATPIDPAARGDLVVSEIMYDPSERTDADGEWIELHNPTLETWTLSDCEIADRVSSWDIGEVVVEPGGWATLARSDRAGFAADSLFELPLNNDGDTVTLRCGDTVIDEVDYEPFEAVAGASLSLDPSALGPDANDEPAAWCPATDPYGMDLGTPGAENPAC